MPVEHRQLYVSTTLVIVIFTTVICGGLTEPILSKMGMRGTGEIDDDDEGEDSADGADEAFNSTDSSCYHSPFHNLTKRSGVTGGTPRTGGGVGPVNKYEVFTFVIVFFLFSLFLFEHSSFFLCDSSCL
jgi:hypothetical protein